MFKSLRIRAGLLTAIWLLMFCLLVLPVAVSQPSVSMGNQAGCPGSEVVLPVSVSGFADVAAITLYIQFDTTAVSFVALENINPALSGGTVVSTVTYDTNPSSLNISWAGMVPASISQGTLFSLRYYLKEKNTLFHFKTDCEIALFDLSIVNNIVYTDGQLAALGALTPDPKTNYVDEGSAARFVLPSLSGVSYQWQENAGSGWVGLTEGGAYSGVKTEELAINPVNPVLNNRLYRCMLQMQTCNEVTSEAALKVSALGIEEQGNDEKPIFIAHPNPVTDELTFITGIPVENGSLRIADISGNIVLLTKPENIPCSVPQTIALGKLPAGMYLLQLMSGSQIVSSVKIIRKL